MSLTPHGIGRPPSRTHGRTRAAKFADEARFLKSWLENPGKTGAVSPSSSFLARAMAAQVDPSVPGPVIELGPGTGPVTQALIRRGVAQERLVLVEFDPSFCKLLKRRFPEARVVQGDAFALSQTLAGLLEAPAAAIVSSLPLLNAHERRRLTLLAAAFRLMSPLGVFVQFTYGMASPISRWSKRGRARCFEARGSGPIWLNLPPARVWTYGRLRSGRRQNFTHAELVISKIRQRADWMRNELKETALRLRDDLRFGPKNHKPRVRLAPAVSKRHSGPK